MEKAPSDITARYATFWEEEGRRAACDQLKTTVYFVLALQLSFTGLDYWAYPEHFEAFTAMRMAVNVYVIAVLYRFRFTSPLISQCGVPAAVAAEIMAMIYATGGPNSYYYTGLIITMVGMPVLQPFRAIDAFGLSSLICIGFALSPFFVDQELDHQHFTIAMVFVLSGLVESTLSSYKLDRARFVDFERRKEIERARDDLKTLDELKDRLTSNIHHELRTPLTLILAPLQAMISGDYGKLPAAARKTLVAMESNGQRLLSVVNNLLDLAKLEGRSFKIERRKGDLVLRVRELVNGAMPLAEKKGIALGFESVGDDCPIYADWDAIDKVALNLLGNALKFTPEGGSVDFRIHSMSNPRDEAEHTDRQPGVLMSVIDSGIGIESEQLDKIFDRFAQVDGSATRKHEGTGIGLALVQELVELHGGQVWAASDGIGHGTTLSVWLPVGTADASDTEEDVAGERKRSLADSLAGTQAEILLEKDDEAATPEAAAADLMPEFEYEEREAIPVEDRPKLVVADDNPDMRDLLTFILGREYDLRVAKDGQEAYELVLESIPDAVLTDLMMPELTGIGLIQKLRELPETRSLPTILITSSAESKTKIEGLEAGADDYVTKPFHPKELLARVRSHVRVGVLQQELAARNEVLEETLVVLKQTQRHMIQNERRAVAGEIAAGIAHEVNNPVNFALNAARAMDTNLDALGDVVSALEGLAWDDQARLETQLSALRERIARVESEEAFAVLRELNRIIRDGLDRTHRLVADLRDLVLPGQGEYSSVDVAENVAAALQLIAHEIEAAGIEVEVDIDDDLPPAKSNSNALNQVLVNLVKNACQAIGGGGGRIQISARRHGETVHILVEDDGPGIPEDLADRIFEPFVTTKDPGQGTGLGLSVCRQIAESHGGTLELLPQVAGGTTFCLTLPVMEAPPADEKPEPGA